MRGVTTFVICAIAITLSGCIYPEGRRTISGHAYPAESLAFLDEPGVTRKEAIATLGLPTEEFSQWRVIAYSWYSAQRWHVSPPDNWGMHESHPETGDQHWALLIAYNEKGIVTAHTLRQIGNTDLNDVAAEWSRSLTAKRADSRKVLSNPH